MKKILQKISAIGLSLFVLFSTFSFTVDFHYCGDHLMDVAFMSPAEACSMGPDTAIIPGDCISQSSCCKDLAFIQEAPEVINHVSDLQYAQAYDLQVTFLLLPQLISGEQEAVNDLTRNYKPPGRSADLQLMFQTFLI